MKLLITGATGFIGSSLVDYLSGKKEYDLGVLVREPSKIPEDKNFSGVSVLVLKEDYRNLPELLKSFQPDAVIHLASLFLSSHDPEDVDGLIESNILFGTKLLEAMSGAGVKHFLNTGTNWETSGTGQDYKPVNLYAATKKAFEDILRYYVLYHDMNAIGFKLFDSYGPFDPRKKLLRLLKQNLGSRDPIAFSGGEQDIDLIYIEDICRVYEKGLEYLISREAREYQDFYIGSGNPVSVREAVEVFQEVYERPLNIDWGKRPYRPGEIMRITADVASTHETLDWKPAVTLREGLKRVREKEARK